MLEKLLHSHNNLFDVIVFNEIFNKILRYNDQQKESWNDCMIAVIFCTHIRYGCSLPHTHTREKDRGSARVLVERSHLNKSVIKTLLKIW